MGRVRVGWMMLVCVAALAPAQVKGQGTTTTYTYEEEVGYLGRFVWNIGGTLNIPLSSTADRQNPGGGFTLGLTYNPTIPVGVQFEYGANWATLRAGPASSVGIGGHTLLQYFDLNLMVRPGFHHGSGFYLLAGGGYYYRGVDVTRVTGTVAVPYCDPWLYYCSVVPVTASQVIGSRSSWDWGLDGGIGFAFGLTQPVRLYLEVRYHYIFGPSFTDSSGSTRHADAQFLPLTIGVRF
jgi:opacity protein-like surface antigen